MQDKEEKKKRVEKGKSYDRKVLEEIAYLKGLDQSLAEELLSRAREKELKAGANLFHAGDPADGCYVILEGSLKAGLFSEEGDEQFLAVLGPGDIVGELALIDQQPRSASVSALSFSRLAFISQKEFQSFADQNPAVYRHMLRILSARLRTTNETLIARSFLPLSGRVAKTLLQLAESFGKPLGEGRILINHRISQVGIANMSGVARENVSRVLSEWRKKGYISRLSHYYCLEDPRALRALCDI